MRDIERRYLPAIVEFRANSDGPGQLYGYAAKYLSLSQNLGGFVENIAPGAFDKSIADQVRVMCRGDHKDTRLLGTTEAGTLRLLPDNVGLGYEVDLPDTSSGRDYGVLAQRTDIRYSSFAFICIEDEWGVTEQGFPLRTLLQVQLIDVAPVANPAYLDTATAKRSLAERINVELDALPALGVEEVRSLILGEPAEQRAQEPDTEAEQRETHSTGVAVQRLQLELDELK
jgi:hypothetical protein